MNWISVEDAMPPLDADNCCMLDSQRGHFSEELLVFDEDSAGYFVATYDDISCCWLDNIGATITGVTHYCKIEGPHPA